MIHTHFKSTKVKNFIIFVLLTAYSFGMFYAGIPKNTKVGFNDIMMFMLILIPIIFFALIYKKIFGQIIYDFIEELIKKQNIQNDLKLILDNLEESIIVIDDKNIEFVNDTFLD